MFAPAPEARPTRRAGVDGFTLIELLVVISIVTLLMGILLPALGKSRDAGRATICLSNARLLSMACVMYAQDDRRERWVTFIPAGQSPTGVAIDRKQLLLPYTMRGASNADVDPAQLWHCPMNISRDAAGQINAAGYGVNSSLNNARLSQILRPSETVALCDAGINDGGTPILSTHVMAPSRTTNAGIGRPNPRHADRVNVAFVDGHAATTPLDLPFYPPDPYPWTGVGVTDPASPDYRDQLWDLQ
jgi:prepilin-type N-terminal cleavage/methylation domain-containing protein/prepilin-type processing-associated H-X9-DG protein